MLFQFNNSKKKAKHQDDVVLVGAKIAFPLFYSE
jgi:hypothetical protein